MHKSANIISALSPAPNIPAHAMGVCVRGYWGGGGPKADPPSSFFLSDLCLYVRWVCPVLAKAVGGGGGGWGLEVVFLFSALSL